MGNRNRPHFPAVTVTLVINSGIIPTAKEAGAGYKTAKENEENMGTNIIVNGVEYASPYEYVNGSDLQKLQQFFGKGDSEICWYEDEEPYGWGFNHGIDPIPDADRSIIFIYGFEDNEIWYNVFQYHNKYYKVAWDDSIGEYGDVSYVGDFFFILSLNVGTVLVPYDSTIVTWGDFILSEFNTQIILTSNEGGQIIPIDESLGDAIMKEGAEFHLENITDRIENGAVYSTWCS